MVRCDGQGVNRGHWSGSRASAGGRPGAPLPRVRGPLDQADRRPSRSLVGDRQGVLLRPGRRQATGLAELSRPVPGARSDRPASKSSVPVSRILSCVARHERRAGEFRSGPTRSLSSSQVIAAAWATCSRLGWARRPRSPRAASPIIRNPPQIAARVGDEVGSNGPLSEVPFPVAALEAVDAGTIDDRCGASRPEDAHGRRDKARPSPQHAKESLCRDLSVINDAPTDHSCP